MEATGEKGGKKGNGSRRRRMLSDFGPPFLRSGTATRIKPQQSSSRDARMCEPVVSAHPSTLDGSSRRGGRHCPGSRRQCSASLPPSPSLPFFPLPLLLSSSASKMTHRGIIIAFLFSAAVASASASPSVRLSAVIDASAPSGFRVETLSPQRSLGDFQNATEAAHVQYDPKYSVEGW